MNINYFKFQGRKSVVSEFYEEIIFQDPTPYMHNLLTTTR